MTGLRVCFAANPTNNAVNRSTQLRGSLKNLDLTRTRVSDQSIEYLAQLKSLSKLTIRRCKITEAGKIELERLRPDVEIVWEPL
jgi:predicted RecB family endonuclease